MTVAQAVYKKEKEMRVQRRATILVQGMADKAYTERLEELKLPPLEYRHKGADVMCRHIRSELMKKNSSIPAEKSGLEAIQKIG